MNQPFKPLGTPPLALGVATALFLLLASFPFIAPWHSPPWYTYYAEWLTAVLGLGIAGCLLGLPRPERLGWTTIWFSAFAVTLMVQTAILQPGYWGPSLTAAAQLGICALLALCAQMARARWGTDRVLTALAVGLVLGGLITAAIGWIQRLDMTSNFPGLVLVHPVDSRQAIGNIGQRNLYGHYLMWAGICAVYLFARFPRFWLPLFALMSWMAFEAALTESRTTLGYYAFWLLIAVPAAVLKPTPLQKRFAWASVWAVALGIVMQFIGADIARQIGEWLGYPIQARAGVDRFAAQGGGLGRRVAEWQKALMVFREHPVFGVGWGYFAGESFRLHTLPQFVSFREDVLWTHSHNSVLQIMAEVGLIGLGLLAGLLALLVRGLLRWQNDVAMLLFPLLGVSLIHSQMEYPLWYLHYLGLFAIFLALLEPEPSMSMRAPKLKLRLPLWAATTVAAVLHPPMYEAITRSVSTSMKAEHVAWLRQVGRIPAFDYLAEDAAVNGLAFNVNDWTYFDGVTRRLMDYRPFPDSNFWRMCVLGHTGRADQVAGLLLHAEVTYPGYAKGFYRDLERYRCLPAGFALPRRPEFDSD